MWWLDPGKEVLNVLFNRILAPYVENLDMNKVSYGIAQGRISLGNLRLKKGALDKFRLPVDVLEGYLGTFTLSLHWMNLGNQPVEILIENVYLLVVPSPLSSVDPEEEEQRAQAAKTERLESAELLHMQDQTAVAADDSAQSKGLWSTLIAKIINNLQVTVKNIHIRYEDNMSVPGHPFAVGVTLAGLNAVSVDENWMPAFIESTAGAVHKLSNLESLAIYFNTNSASMAGLAPAEALNRFTSLIAHEGQEADHQFILKPVSGQGRIVMNHRLDQETPRFDVQLLFDELGIALDANQYRDVISLIDMYHVYARQHQYRRFRPPETEFVANIARARLTFACHAIFAGIHERNRRWTWAYFAERRDDREKYVTLFKKRLLNQLAASDVTTFQNLEKKLPYEDIRFYRSIARSYLRKDAALRRKVEEENKKKQAQASKGWTSWLWGSTQEEQTPTSEALFGGTMTEQQRNELYNVLNHDERAALADAIQPDSQALKTRILAKLRKGSFALRADSSSGPGAHDVISVMFSAFQANVLQRAVNFEASVSLGGFGVFDGASHNSLHPQIVCVRGPPNDTPPDQSTDTVNEDPFFYVKFERKPLDNRSESALTVCLRHTEVIYHRSYIEAIQRFFKPPASQLESVEALLNVASETFEGLRKTTRAGLEYALETHKSVDLRMDLNAPIIIIPEDITTYDCKHLVIDAGHIAIESDPVDPALLQIINNKKSQKYEEEDYKRLGSAMYDKFFFKLRDAQFLIGNNLQACRDALASQERSALHLLERTSIDFQVQSSIVPKYPSISRLIISGNLTGLQVNVSDVKYKSLMRLIDVCIPKFDEDDDISKPLLTAATKSDASAFRLSPTLFRRAEGEYHIEEDQEQHEQRHHLELETSSASPKALELRQPIIEFNFQVHDLRASMSKSNGNGGEKLLGDILFERFSIQYSQATFDMKVNINLRSMSMRLVQPGMEPMEFVSSAAADMPDEDLLTIDYKRVQKMSPEFWTLFEGTDQSVDIQVSTFIFHAAPEPVVGLYDFIMSTFVPQSPEPASRDRPSDAISLADSQVPAPNPPADKIRVVVRLASVKVILINDQVRIATLSLPTAMVTVLLASGTMCITGHLGNLSLSNDSTTHPVLPEFNQILSIEGKNLAEFGYETFDPHAESYAGISSSVYLRAGSIKCHFLEQPLHDVYLFITKLAKLKVLYDAATQVAVQKASEIQRMRFDISVKSPILVIPSNSATSRDVLTMRLGEITARNSYEATADKISASLQGIRLASTMYIGERPSTLSIIDDINVSAEIIQTSGIDRSKDLDYPDTQVIVHVSNVGLHLTKVQYLLLLELSRSIPRVLAAAPKGDIQAQTAMSPSSSVELSNLLPSPPSDRPLVDLRPEIRPSSGPDGKRNVTALDLAVTVGSVKLHMYDALVNTDADLEDHGIACLALINSSLRLKMLSDGSLEAQVVLKSFTMSNTRVGSTKFREIFPAAQHDRDQIMLLFTMSGGAQTSSLAVLTIDSPRIIFAIDPIFGLMEFFTIADKAPEYPDEQSIGDAEKLGAIQGNQSSIMEFRVEIHELSVIVLENDADPSSDSIRLTVNRIFLSQQGILALNVNRLGMSLMRMDKESETVRFLDDVDLTFSLDNRLSSHRQMTSIDVTVNPVVFRASYQDINMIMAIVNRAISLYGSSQRSSAPPVGEREPSTTARVTVSHSLPKSRARVMTTKEMLKGSSDGFRLVLIGDLQEQPMLHLKIKPFTFAARDWSEELRATTTMTMQISYWNLTNSHWEPLIDPWAFTTSISRDAKFGGMSMKISARDRFNFNLSTTFAELALTTVRVLGRESERISKRIRGSYAPYRIHNRVGRTIGITSISDGGNIPKARDEQMELPHDKSVDWRFDDWKTMREHVSTSPRHSIRVAFPDGPWEPLQSIPVDREGEYIFSLWKRKDGQSAKKVLETSRLLCEVRVMDNVKVVTIRSMYRVENRTLYPLELGLTDEGSSSFPMEKIVPGHDYAVPIESVVQRKIKLRPDQGFGYKWCLPFRWEDLISRNAFTIQCPHTDPRESAFQIQAYADVNPNDDSRRCPRIILKLRAPIELENLLPYDLQYRIYNKETDRNWRSYLRKGGIMPVHSEELGHLLMLSLEVQDTVFKTSDFAIINHDGRSDFNVENKLTLQDPSDRKLYLRMNYIRYPDAGGAFKVQIYSPYIIVNKTGLPFWVKSSRFARAGSDVAGDTRTEVLSQPIPFLLSHPHHACHEFCLKFDDSTWSKTLNFEAPAGDTELVVACQNRKSEEVHIGLSWTEGLGKYKLTKIITLAPRFLIKNTLPDPLSFRAHGVAPHDGNIIEPGQRLPLHFLRTGQKKLLTVAYPGLNTPWSPPINIEDLGLVHFRLRRHGSAQSPTLIQADIKIEGSTIFVHLGLAQDGWPIMIENESDYNVSLSQTDDSQATLDGSRPSYPVAPHSTLPYAWDYPAAPEKRIQLTVHGITRTVDIKEIGALPPLKFRNNNRSQALSLDIRARQHTHILSITHYHPERSVYKPKGYKPSTFDSLDSIASGVEAFEAMHEDAPPTLTLTLECAGIGLSLVNRKLVEVIYISMDALKLEYTDSRAAQTISVSCGWLQIDNQLQEALYPVILQPTPIPRDSSEAAAPTVQGSLICLRDRAHGVIFVKYCSVLLQALTVETDEDLLFAIYDLTQIKGVSWEDESQDVLIQNPAEIPEPSNAPTGDDFYFERLELHPIKLSLSFMRTERVNSDEKLSIRNPLAVVVNALTMTIGNVNDAPLELNALVVTDMRLNLPEMQNRITYHYRQDVLRQLYRIIGSADFIGNPVGLFTNVSSGVADMFYEPFHGVVMHGNKELTIGIAKGAASLVKKTVFGLSDSVTKFTSSVGKGISAATFDSEWQAARRMQQRRNRPRHAIYGITAGGTALVTSLASAAEGVVTKPLEGAESGGAVGFFKGFGKGLVGLVTKPVVGAFDMASNISAGVRNTTTVFDSQERDRIRMPRHTPADGVLRSYSERDALGQYMMKDLENGSYRKEFYVAHIDIPGGDNVVLLTATRVLSFWSKKLRLDWDLPLTQVQGVQTEPTGILFIHKQGSGMNKFVLIPDKKSQTWFFGEVAAVVRTFNQQRRMDN